MSEEKPDKDQLDWEEWRRHPGTLKFFSILAGMREINRMDWERGTFTKDMPFEAIAQKNVIEVTRNEIYRDLERLTFEDFQMWMEKIHEIRE